MRRHPLRAEAKVTAQHDEKRVRLRIGTDLWTLTAGEAHDLADRLHDAAEALDRKDTP
ncbi:hypothetical protein [Rhodococcus aetherivorans]